MTERMTKGVWPYLILAAFCLLLYLPGIASLPPVDRDEPRYAQASRQMVESGDYVRIRFLEVPRNKKPVGIYWLQSSCAWLTGEKDAIWTYRIPSLLGAITAVLVLFAVSCRLMSSNRALLASVLLAACPTLIIVSHAATTDAVLLAVTVMAQACLLLVYVRGRDGSGARVPVTVALLFWAAQGAAVLVKGPITPAISLLTFFALWWNARSAAWAKPLHPAIGVPVCLGIVALWPVMFILKAGWPAFVEFLHESVGRDFLGKVGSGRESHGAVPGYYLAVSLVVLWAVFPLFWKVLPACWRDRKAEPLAAACLAWLVPGWLVFELIPTKLPHYVLPFYPPVFLMVAAMAGRSVPAAEGFWKWSGRLVSAVWWTTMIVLALALPVVGWFVDQRLYPLALLPAVAAIGCGLYAWRHVRQGNMWRALAPSVVFSVLFFVPAFGFIFPRLDTIWMSRKTAAMVHEYERSTGKHAVAFCAGYEEPSLAFSLGTDTRLEAGVYEAAQALAQNPNAVALVQDQAAPVDWGRLLPTSLRSKLNKSVTLKPDSCCREAFLREVARLGLKVRVAAYADGFNHSKGKWVRVMLYVADNGRAEGE